MMHAKTAVVDGTWCRVGSSNLNTASLIGNWEIDAGVLDRGLAEQLEGLFLADLASSREIVLPAADRSRLAVPYLPGERETPKDPLDPHGSLPERLERALERGGGRRVGMAPLVRAGSVLGGALAGNRPLGREDRTVLGTLAVATLVVALLAALLPTVIGWAVALVAFWFGAVMGFRAWAQARRAHIEEKQAALAAARHDDDQQVLP
jgi:cardiolipin synthase